MVNSAEINPIYHCPRGHTFSTDSPMIIAVDNDPEYNSGIICHYCYVDWFRLNVNAEEIPKNINDNTNKRNT